MISPDDTFTRFLDVHDNSRPSPEDSDQRPAIVVPYGSSRSWTRFQQQLDDILSNNDLTDAQTYPRIETLLETVIVKKQHVEALGDTLTDRQLLLLAHGLRGDAYLAESDRKNFASPSPLVAAASAESADHTPASV